MWDSVKQYASTFSGGATNVDIDPQDTTYTNVDTDRNGNTNNRATWDESCCPNFTMQERISAFCFFSILGYILQLGSITKYLSSIVHLDPGHFA